MRWLPTSPRRRVALAAGAEKCGYLPSAAPGEGHAGAAVPVAVHDAALDLEPHRRAHGPQPDGHVDHRRVAQGGDERGAARADGVRRRRVGRAVLGALVRGAAEHDVVLTRHDVDEPLRIGLVEQPLAHRGRGHADDLATHRDQRRVGGQLARAEAGAVDDGVGVELVERGDLAALGRWIDMSTTGATKRRPSPVRSSPGTASRHHGSGASGASRSVPASMRTPLPATSARPASAE